MVFCDYSMSGISKSITKEDLLKLHEFIDSMHPIPTKIEVFKEGFMLINNGMTNIINRGLRRGHGFYDDYSGLKITMIEDCIDCEDEVECVQCEYYDMEGHQAKITYNDGSTKIINIR